MQRCVSLQLSVVSAALISLAEAGLALIGPSFRSSALTAAGRSVFAAVSRGVLDGMLPAAGQTAALQDQLLRVDAAIASSPPAMQAELRQLVTLLGSPPGHLLLIGLQPGCPDASTAEIRSMLQTLRVPSLPLPLQTFHALRDITNVAYFAHAGTWSAMGYPGTRVV